MPLDAKTVPGGTTGKHVVVVTVTRTTARTNVHAPGDSGVDMVVGERVESCAEGMAIIEVSGLKGTKPATATAIVETEVVPLCWIQAYIETTSDSLRDHGLLVVDGSSQEGVTLKEQRRVRGAQMKGANIREHVSCRCTDEGNKSISFAADVDVDIARGRTNVVDLPQSVPAPSDSLLLLLVLRGAIRSAIYSLLVIKEMT